MTQLIDHVSALCADWNTISPRIACSTCVRDASKLSLGILLETALTNKGLAALHTEGLVQVQTLCQIIAIMTMNLMTILLVNTEEAAEDSDTDTDFMFVEAEPQKVGRFTGLLSVEEWEAAGWQLAWNLPATPMLWDINDMLDMSEDYDAELYRDRES
ncbi:hypothetical protein Moror_3737 [Moniliophthora roreri MCA 2997]|uniref:Uncharacterized protein n=2 Tax=Moniliophthora roreri TaxID=221103 RepID=V2XPF9_MONRO|nr:hypothetical protein Moror_3737 [Moniliophthora roreri MCA 2997]